MGNSGFRHGKVLVHGCMVAMLLLALSLSLRAQSSDTLPAVPDVPQPEAASAAPLPEEPQPEEVRYKRILGLLPRYRSVSIHTYPEPETPRQKFDGFARQSFDYSAFIIVGMSSGISLWRDSAPELGQGAAGYGRYYWRHFVDRTNENFWVQFALPVMLRHDARVYVLGGKPGNRQILRRTGFALSRLLVARTDGGDNTFNSSEVVGSGVAAAMSNLYYPSSNRGWGETGKRWGINLGVDAAAFVFKEFWPDVSHAIFRTP